MFLVIYYLDLAMLIVTDLFLAAVLSSVVEMNRYFPSGSPQHLGLPIAIDSMGAQGPGPMGLHEVSSQTPLRPEGWKEGAIVA